MGFFLLCGHLRFFCLGLSPFGFQSFNVLDEESDNDCDRQEARRPCDNEGNGSVPTAPPQPLFNSTDWLGPDRNIAQDAIQFLGQLPRSLIASGGILFQTLKADRIEIARDRRIEQSRRNGFFVKNVFQNLRQTPSSKR